MRSDEHLSVSRKLRPEKKVLARQLRRQMTPAEALLWEKLRLGRLNGLHFRRQQVIDGFVADFYCHDARLVIEVDGRIHEKNKQYDEERDQIIGTHQLQIIRFPNDRVLNDTYAVLAEILAAAQACSPLPGGEGGQGGEV